MKRCIPIILSLILCLCAFAYPVSASALEPREEISGTDIFTAKDVEIWSEDFPDAYVEINDTTASRVGTASYVEATVYFEENIHIIDGNMQVTDSRLLSESEVNAIGKTKFANNSSIVQRGFGPLPEYITSRGKLTFRFNGFEYTVGRYQLAATATWSEGDYGLLYGLTNPYSGDDYIGFVWGGSYDFVSPPVSMRIVDNWGALRATVPPHTIEPNKGVVWAYNEGATSSSGMDYVPTLTVYTDIVKNNLTGGGNTTSLVSQYIHTYGTVSGSISFSSAGASFSLGAGAGSQWTISLAISGISY